MVACSVAPSLRTKDPPTSTCHSTTACSCHAVPRVAPSAASCLRPLAHRLALVVASPSTIRATHRSPWQPSPSCVSARRRAPSLPMRSPGYVYLVMRQHACVCASCHPHCACVVVHTQGNPCPGTVGRMFAQVQCTGAPVVVANLTMASGVSDALVNINLHGLNRPTITDHGKAVWDEARFQPGVAGVTAGRWGSVCCVL